LHELEHWQVRRICIGGLAAFIVGAAIIWYTGNPFEAEPLTLNWSRLVQAFGAALLVAAGFAAGLLKAMAYRANVTDHPETP